MIRCYLGLGSNIGHSYSLFQGAIGAIKRLDNTEVIQTSSYYQSTALDENQPQYLNMVIEIKTSMNPEHLLQKMQEIQVRFGRNNATRQSRTLDIDILLYGKKSICYQDLIIPHPQLLQRSFVLQPLAEIAVDLSIQGKSIKQESIHVNNPSCSLQNHSLPFAVITAYDSSSASLAEAAGMSYILVGDSLGNVIQGQDNTHGVSLDSMIYHTKCVAAGLQHTPIIADLPKISMHKDKILNACHQLLEAGASFVKLECDPIGITLMPLLNASSIPFCAHIGLLPQSSESFRVYGKNVSEATLLKDQAQLAEQNDAAMIILECVESLVAQDITSQTTVATIGIGSGKHLDAQVLVMQDVLGVTTPLPKHAKNFLQDSSSVQEALKSFVCAVENREFP